MIKITNKDIAQEFGLCEKTVSNYRNSKGNRHKIYLALKEALATSDFVWEITLKDNAKEYVNNSKIGLYILKYNRNIALVKLFNLNTIK